MPRLGHQDHFAADRDEVPAPELASTAPLRLAVDGHGAGVEKRPSLSTGSREPSQLEQLAETDELAANRDLARYRVTT